MLFKLNLGQETSVFHGRRVSIKAKTLAATPPNTQTPVSFGFADEEGLHYRINCVLCQINIGIKGGIQRRIA